MAVYGLSNRTTNVTTANAALELRTTATDRVEVTEVGCFLSSATASTYGIGRPAAIGVTPTSPITWLALDPASPAGTAQTALAWGTGPTVPANFFKRFILPANIGTGYIAIFPNKLVVAVSSSIVLWNLATNVAVDCHVEGNE